MILRSPISLSEAHWVFQQKLHQPQLISDKLTYTTAEPFTTAEVQAWWFCFQALTVVDQELRLADSILVDQDLPRFQARGVLGLDEPKSLTRYVPTQGWAPVDTRIRVGGVAKLVRQMGGEELYSEGPSVALRELVQNAADAIQARRVNENRPSDWGAVEIRLACKADQWWLSVADDGIGMSDSLLTGPFLDFGSSYWDSDLVISEHPGLLARGFQPVGKFGIGFFSVFMLGDVVRITTRPYREAQRDTRVLEFSAGVSSVPVLRFAEPSDQLPQGGTRVEILLRTAPEDEQGLLNSVRLKGTFTLDGLIRYLCPASTVSIWASCEGTGHAKILDANDWAAMPPRNLIQRCNARAKASDVRKLASRIRDVRDGNGNLLGRAAIVSWRECGVTSYLDGVLSVGGFRSSALNNVAGLLLGRPITADRSQAVPLTDGPELAAWATAQAELVHAAIDDDFDLAAAAEAAGVVVACGGDPGKLPICFSEKGWLTSGEIKGWLARKKQVLLVESEFLDNVHRFVDDFKLRDDVLVVEGLARPVNLKRATLWPSSAPISHQWWREFHRTLKGLVVSTAAEYWGVPVNDVLLASKFSTPEKYWWGDIGVAGGTKLRESLEIIRRPKASVVRVPASPGRTSKRK